jgi:hypothetical protein
MKKITGIFFIFFFVLGISNFSLAAGTSGKVYLEYISQKATGEIFIKTTTAHNNPDSCLDGASMAVILNDHPFKKEFLASALTAQSSGVGISFYFGGCFNYQSKEYPYVNAIVLYNN